MAVILRSDCPVPLSTFSDGPRSSPMRAFRSNLLMRWMSSRDSAKACSELRITSLIVGATMAWVFCPLHGAAYSSTQKAVGILPNNARTEQSKVRGVRTGAHRPKIGFAELGPRNLRQAVRAFACWHGHSSLEHAFAPSQPNPAAT